MTRKVGVLEVAFTMVAMGWVVMAFVRVIEAVGWKTTCLMTAVGLLLWAQVWSIANVINSFSCKHQSAGESD